MRPADAPIRQAVTVPVPVDRAFSAFADLVHWWPREYTGAADTLEDIGIETARAVTASNGALTASPATGGRVLAWEPPRPTQREQAPRTRCCKLATACERGGTGRRAGFRSRCPRTWGFESPRSHTTARTPL